MLSRVAESIYWMNRYIERAENVARFVDVNLHLSLDLPGGEDAGWGPLVDVTGDRTTFEDHYDSDARENVIEFLTLDPDYPNSILSCLHRARENARSVREIISTEMWEQLNRYFLMVRGAAFGDRDIMAAPHAFFSEVKLSSHLFAGVMDATMSHGEAWHFGRLGRFLERADKTSRIVDVKYFVLLPEASWIGTALDTAQWGALLRSASALEMYRKRHGRLDPVRVAEFLVLDREFPRAIRYCLRQAQGSLHAITGSAAGTFANAAEQRLGRVRSELDYVHIEEVVEGGLHEFLDGFQGKLNDVAGAIHETFFALPPVVPLGHAEASA